MRPAVAAAFAIVIASQLAEWSAIRSINAPTNIVVMVPPIVAVSAPAAPKPAPVPPPPPAATKPAPQKPLPSVAAAVDEPVTHVRAARDDAYLIAAWNDDHVFVSRDGGRTFARVLDSYEPLADVGFDAAGDTLAIRGARIGVRDASGAEAWREIPGILAGNDGSVHPDQAAATPQLVDGGPDIVVVAGTSGFAARYLTMIAASSDRGASWRYHELDGVYEAQEVHGAQAANGTITIALPVFDCDYEALAWVRWTRDGHFDIHPIAGATRGFQVYGDRAATGTSWVRRRDRTWHAIEYANDGATAIDAPTPTIVDNHEAWAIERGKLTSLPWCVTGTAPMIDAAGRMWMIDEHGAPVLAKSTCDSRQ
ncbi:MAG TPA: hypothetical protein VGG74_22540 [Kofleriaceae bacterium]